MAGPVNLAVDLATPHAGAEDGLQGQGRGARVMCCRSIAVWCE